MQPRISRSWREAGLGQLKKLTPKGAMRAEDGVLKSGTAVRVTAAYDAEADTLVVVKRFKGEATRVFAKSEADLMRAVPAHPNVQALLAFGTRPAQHKTYVVTAYAGQSYHGIEANPRKAVYTALAGLAHLHRHYILHGDLHAGNVLFGSDGTATLIDFGVAVRGRIFCALVNWLRYEGVKCFGADVAKLCETLTSCLQVAAHHFPGAPRDAAGQMVLTLRALRSSELVRQWARGHVPSDAALKDFVGAE